MHSPNDRHTERAEKKHRQAGKEPDRAGKEIDRAVKNFMDLLMIQRPNDPVAHQDLT